MTDKNQTQLHLILRVNAQVIRCVDAQQFLRPELVPHRKHSSNSNCQNEV
jgi:hypothetical protein